MGKASQPYEFGKLLRVQRVQEAENQFITDYEVDNERPADSSLLVDAVKKHPERTVRVPQLGAADGGFYPRSSWPPPG